MNLQEQLPQGVNLHQKLSENFRLGELIKSNTAVRLGIDNTPNFEQLENLRDLACSVLQPVRESFGITLISSGFRCQRLNAALGSSGRSQHLTGNAVDIEVPGVDNYVLANWIKENLMFDQLILEFYDGTDPSSGWVHVSYKTLGNRGQCLTINQGTVKRGLVK